MAVFDHKLWKDRAWDRLGRALRRIPKRNKAKTSAAEASWARDVIAIDDLTRLVEWCGARGLGVEFVKKPMGTYHAGSKKVSISSRAGPVKQLVLLLHECGHHLIGMKEHHDRFGMGYPQTDPAITRTFHHRVSVLDEEMEAWARGWKLARRLDLTLPRETFDAIRLDCIRSYLSWAMSPSGSED